MSHSTDSKSIDFEVKDAQLIFDFVWNKLVDELKLENMRFPREVIWLNGAPGAGKGTQTKFIMKYRGLTAKPIVVSSLLNSPEAKRLIDQGMMVGDREVTELLFRELLLPKNQSGIIVDGFPRTKVQVLCLKLLHERLNTLRREHLNTELSKLFHKPVFHIVVLFVDEAESVRRQLYRGQEAARQAQSNAEAGEGESSSPRTTDQSEESARKRYLTFKEVTYESLKSLRRVFHYHYVDAHGNIHEVQDLIRKEMRYQSSLELDQETNDVIAGVPLATSLSTHARQELIQRLESYTSEHGELFENVVQIIKDEFFPIISRHGISGKSYINSEEQIFDEPLAIAMVIDVFSERGYHMVVDQRRYAIPTHIDLKTGVIEHDKIKVWRFIVKFSPSSIRRGR